MSSPSAALDLRDRAGAFRTLEAAPFDVLVIGAGITGTGIARDLALRGLRVALVDAQDIAAGTSSRSSKLVHGGLRYLVEGHVTVVREAASERKILRRIAPHLALTMPMVLPAHSRAALQKLRTGMWTYEKLGDVAPHERHEVWDVDRLRAEEPAVRTDGVVAAVVYPEYATDDARLTLANARSAAAAGAHVVTYCAVERVLVEGGAAAGAEVRDTLPGAERGATVRARVVVNAAGPWVDAVRRLEDPAAPPKLQLTEGIHVTIPRERLPLHRTVVMAAADKRSVFALPRGRFVYFGTTDTFYPEPEYWPRIDTADVDYLLAAASGVFTGPAFTHADVVGLWSGVRPLLGEAGKKPSEISRRDEVLRGRAGVLSVAGGKLTSYRAMAERVADTCEQALGRAPGRAPTADAPLPGGDFDGDVDALAARLRGMGLGEADAERAARLYGDEAQQVYADGTGPGAEAAHAVRCEGALTLEDYWLRRSRRGLFDADGGLDALEPAAARMGELLGWDERARARQIQACRARHEAELRAVCDAK